MQNKVLICKDCTETIKKTTSKLKVQKLGTQIHKFNRKFLIAEKNIFGIPYSSEELDENVGDQWNNIKIQFPVALPIDIKQHKIPIEKNKEDDQDDVIYVGTIVNQETTERKKRVSKHDTKRYKSTFSFLPIHTTITDHKSDISLIGKFQLFEN